MKLVIFFCLLIALIAADSCGGNCPSGKCPSCYCGNSKNVVDIATWCGKHSWNQACCKCIVSHESGGNANALNYNSNASTDAGLWQINSVSVTSKADSLGNVCKWQSTLRSHSQPQLRYQGIPGIWQLVETLVNPHCLWLLILNIVMDEYTPTQMSLKELLIELGESADCPSIEGLSEGSCKQDSCRSLCGLLESIVEICTFYHFDLILVKSQSYLLLSRLTLL